MEARELMVGNWVYGKQLLNGTKEAFQIYQIDGEHPNYSFFAARSTRPYSRQHMDSLDIEPIPLSAEILEDNFKVAAKTSKKSEYPGIPYVWEIAENRNIIRSSGKFIIGGKMEFDDYTNSFDIVRWFPVTYVHELQQALRLIGLTSLADTFKVHDKQVDR